MSHEVAHQTASLLKRMNKIEGQIGGIKKMITEERSFPDILIQLNATKSAIQKVSQLLLEAHADHTIMHVSEGADMAKEMTNLKKAISQYSKIL